MHLIGGKLAVQVPFEDVLPYKDFALRLPQHMIYELPAILGDMLTNHAQLASFGVAHAPVCCCLCKRLSANDRFD